MIASLFTHRILTSASAICLFMLLMLVPTGCFSAGTDYDTSKVANIQKGVTTEAQLIGWFGQPTSRNDDSEGNTHMTWLYTHANVKGTTFIPVVGAFAGGTNNNGKTLKVTLRGGVVQQFSTESNQIETQETH